MMVKVGILTVSDRSSSGDRPDVSGPALKKIVENQGWTIDAYTIVPDEISRIKNILQEWVDIKKLNLILTTGGTGFSTRDVTPEATLQVITKETPGLSEAIRFEGMKSNLHAILSRGISGISKQTLIVNLPGNPKAAAESFEVIIPVLPHAFQLLQNNPDSEQGHHTGN